MTTRLAAILTATALLAVIVLLGPHPHSLKCIKPTTVPVTWFGDCGR